MKTLRILLVLALVGCSDGGEPERHTATVDVDMQSVPAMLEAIDAVTGGEIDVGGLVEMTESVPIDQEKQADLQVSVNGEEVELFYHVWREQPGWVHIYASSTSRSVVDLVQSAIDPFAREATP